MGAIWISRGELIETVNEVVGYKSGLALNYERMSSSVPTAYADVWTGDHKEIIRVRSEVFESIVHSILHGVGNVAEPEPVPPIFRLLRKHNYDPAATKVLNDLLPEAIALLGVAVNKTADSENKTLDVEPLFAMAIERHGKAGVNLMGEFLESIGMHLHESPWSTYRRVEWQDTAELEELFNSESLQTLYGTFIDQRYIDYLHQNFDDIASMNWRKFEGLTCEFFERAGFRVEIGAGRGDGGIDARIWSREADPTQPPLIPVQCKRYKDLVDSTIVKALWFDMHEEEAKSGLVVTTSGLSPAAHGVARGHNIEQADRTALRQWVEAMKSPYSGV